MTHEPVPVVLDTNVVLDWLLFRDGRASTLARALQGGWLQWLVCARMRDEFVWTLQRAALSRWQPDPAQLLAHFDRHAHMLPEPPVAPARLRCDDPDDQVFIDLALSGNAHWLLSHDKALLRLGRRMPTGGPRIARLADWPGA